MHRTGNLPEGEQDPPTVRHAPGRERARSHTTGEHCWKRCDFSLGLFRRFKALVNHDNACSFGSDEVSTPTLHTLNTISLVRTPPCRSSRSLRVCELSKLSHATGCRSSSSSFLVMCLMLSIFCMLHDAFAKCIRMNGRHATLPESPLSAAEVLFGIQFHRGQRVPESNFMHR